MWRLITTDLVQVLMRDFFQDSFADSREVESVTLEGKLACALFPRSVVSFCQFLLLSDWVLVVMLHKIFQWYYERRHNVNYWLRCRSWYSALFSILLWVVSFIVVDFLLVMFYPRDQVDVISELWRGIVWHNIQGNVY